MAVAYLNHISKAFEIFRLQHLQVNNKSFVIYRVNLF